MSTEVCVSCQEVLVLDIDPASDEESAGKGAASQEQVLDDVELRCGCHYHWECLLDLDTVLECSNCSQDVSSDGRQRVLCTVRNEGGTQQHFDILPPAREEAYFRSNPEERRGHAFLEFCKDGDTDAIVHLVKDEDEEGHHDILRYQDAFGGSMETGLHVSIRHGQDTAVWLLLYLASSLDDASFPPHVKKALQNAGLTIKDRRPQPDIRSLTDSSDRTALDLATGQQGSRWEGVLRNNALIVRE